MTVSRLALGGMVLGAGCLLGLGVASKSLRARHDGPECRLSMPSSSVDPMVFPTKGGPSALDAAILGNADDDAIRRVISEQGGFTVAHGTPCSEVEAGPVFSQVLITDGPFVGKVVWAPTSHTHGAKP